MQYSIVGDSYAVGIDNTDDYFKISYAATAGTAVLGTNDRLIIDASGNVGVGSTSPPTNFYVSESNTDTVPAFELEQLSTGDAGMQFSISGDSYVVGIDNTDDKFKISYASTAGTAVLGTADRFAIDADGSVEVGTGGTINNATGAGDLYVLSDLEVDGLIYGDGTNISNVVASSVAVDSLDFAQFEDTLDLDASTEMNFGAYNFNMDLDSTGDFQIMDAGVVQHIFYDTGDVRIGESNEFYMDTSEAGVGFGTSAPQTNMHLYESNTDTEPGFELEQVSTGDAGMQFSIGGDSYAIGIDNTDDDFKISYAATAGTAVLGTNTQMSIDSAGGFGVGSDVVPSTMKMVISDDIPRLAFHNNDADPNATGEEDEIGGIFFGGTYDGTNYDYGALIVAEVDADWTSSHRGADLYFKTQDALSGLLRRMVIAADGNVGIADNTPTYKLDVNGTIRGYTITDSSDRRYKENIEPIGSVLEKLMKIRGVFYNWIDRENHGDQVNVGFIAQELEPHFPELVRTDSDGYKSVTYGKMTAILVEAIKELKESQEQKDQEIDLLKQALCKKDSSYVFCQ